MSIDLMFFEFQSKGRHGSAVFPTSTSLIWSGISNPYLAGLCDPVRRRRFEGGRDHPWNEQTSSGPIFEALNTTRQHQSELVVCLMGVLVVMAP